MRIEAITGEYRPVWRGGHSTYLDVNGEYLPTQVPHWYYTLGVRSKWTSGVAGSGPLAYVSSTDVIAHLSITGFHSQGRRRPQMWDSWLTYGQAKISLGKGRCKSVSQAIREVDKLITEEAINSVLRGHSKYRVLMQAVYRLKESTPRIGQKMLTYGPQYSTESLLDPKNWEPWATDLRTGSDSWYRDLPLGVYFTISANSELSGSIVCRGYGGGYSGLCDPAYAPLAATLGFWPVSESNLNQKTGSQATV
jgi:hypothetical protein